MESEMLSSQSLDQDESSRSAAVSPFLSLSQIQRVVSRIPNREAWDRSTEEPWHFSLDRLPGGQPLEIQRLQLTPGLYPGMEDDEQTEADGPCLQFAEMLDPREVCTFQYDGQDGADFVSLGRAWSRLERLVFANAFPSQELCTYGFTERNSVSRPLDVEFRFSQANPDCQAILSLDLGWDSAGEGPILPLSLRQNVSVVLRVESPSFAQRLQDCHPGELEGSNFTQSWNAIKWEPY